MISQLHLTTLVIAATVIWGITLLLQGAPVGLDWLKPYSTVVGILPLVLLVFDKWLWRLRILHGWFVKKPNLQGTWKAQLRSTWNEGASEAREIEGYMIIRQTYSSIAMRLVTSESSSELIACNISRSDDGLYEVVGVYHNVPKLLERRHSPVHFGGLILRVLGDLADALEGQYWTDRSTLGEIRLSERSSVLYYGYESAKRGLAKNM
jgi:SMODS-associating 2TM, beta-strand rich effector domain